MVHAGCKTVTTGEVRKPHPRQTFGSGGSPNGVHGNGAERYEGGCVSAPMDRLIGDAAAKRFGIEALAVMHAAPLMSGPAHSLAVAVVALARDRPARLEIAAGIGKERSI